jgi:hypothetical protein
MYTQATPWKDVGAAAEGLSEAGSAVLAFDTPPTWISVPIFTTPEPVRWDWAAPADRIRVTLAHHTAIRWAADSFGGWMSVNEVWSGALNFAETVRARAARGVSLATGYLARSITGLGRTYGRKVLEWIRARREQRNFLAFRLWVTFSSAERIERSAATTALALRLHVDHSVPPRRATAITPRKLRGPNTAGRIPLPSCGMTT